MKPSIIRSLCLCLPLLLTACGTGKSTVSGNGKSSAENASVGKSAVPAGLAFMQKVSDNQLYAKNIVGRMTFTVSAQGKEISAPGSLHMRKDQVIRLQVFVPILGTEVGRLEFTPDYVLVIDRLHKQYIKADYTQLDFLKDNGLTFYSLQSLFWNQLLLPGTDKVKEKDLSDFTVDLNSSGSTYPVSLKRGNMTYVWTADKQTGRISQAKVDYKSQKNGNSTLVWKYDDFKNVGVKLFPATQKFTFTTSATRKQQTASVSIEMDGIGTDDKWETTSTVSSKYKKVETSDILSKLLEL